MINSQVKIKNQIIDFLAVRLRLKNYLTNYSLVYILVNVFVAFLGFFRSFAFMKFFDFRELGIITLVNTAAMLVGFFQFGLINGGYRIIALGQEDSNTKTNNVVFSYFGLLSVLLIILSIFGYIFGFFSDWLILLVINVMGIGMLLSNWLSNTLIGSGEYALLNKANIVSSTTSLICLVLVYYFGLYGALLSLIIQPLLFVAIVFIFGKNKIPTKFDIDYKHIKHMLSFGFIPFLSGIFFLAYQQIERWSVNFFLGPESLGKMYLVFLTTTLWVLVPSSILNLFFPKAIKFFNNNDLVNFNNIIRRNTLIILMYCVSISILILLVLNPLVGLIFPQHQPYVYLVEFGLPALIFRTLCDPISLYLNSVVKLAPIFWSDVFSLSIYVISLIFLFINNLFSIDYFIICFNIYFSIKFIFLIIVYIKIRKSNK